MLYTDQPIKYTITPPKREHDDSPKLTPDEALEKIMTLLSKCNGNELCMIAELLGTMISALDRYAPPSETEK